MQRRDDIRICRIALDAAPAGLLLAAVVLMWRCRPAWLAILLALLCLAVAAGALYVRHRVLNPLIQLKDILESAGEDGEETVDDEAIRQLMASGGEVGALLTRLTESVHSDSKAQALNAEVALYALQSEINPHFLYNALEAIRNYAMNYGVNEISEMTLALARIFRYSISRPGEVATLADEIGNVKNYMKIQNYRFPDRFELVLDMDESDNELMRCSLPVLTLQPIVENALNHGLEKLMRPGRITLRAQITERNLIITVSDNGVGMSPEKLDQLREKLASGFVAQNTLPGRQLHRKTGVSLNNVNNRLKIYFGSEYGMTVTSCEGAFTTVEIVVPRIMVP